MLLVHLAGQRRMQEWELQGQLSLKGEDDSQQFHYPDVCWSCSGILIPRPDRHLEGILWRKPMGMGQCWALSNVQCGKRGWKDGVWGELRVKWRIHHWPLGMIKPSNFSDILTTWLCVICLHTTRDGELLLEAAHFHKPPLFTNTKELTLYFLYPLTLGMILGSSN